MKLPERIKLTRKDAEYEAQKAIKKMSNIELESFLDSREANESSWRHEIKT